MKSCGGWAGRERSLVTGGVSLGERSGIEPSLGVRGGGRRQKISNNFFPNFKGNRYFDSETGIPAKL